MANSNTVAAWKGLPSQVITTTTPTALLVPAAGAYAVLPSPILLAGTGLPLFADPTAQSGNPQASAPTYVNSVFDGSPMIIRCIVEATTAGAYTFTTKLYQVPYASVIPTNISATVTNDNLVCTGATFTAGGAGTSTYVLTASLIWDSVSAQLQGSFSTLAGGTFTGGASTTAVAAVKVDGLNFIPVFTFGTANAGNSVLVKEFSIEQV